MVGKVFWLEYKARKNFRKYLYRSMISSCLDLIKNNNELFIYVVDRQTVIVVNQIKCVNQLSDRHCIVKQIMY